MKEKAEDSWVGRLNSINVSVQLKLRIPRGKKKKNMSRSKFYRLLQYIIRWLFAIRQMDSKPHYLYQDKFQIDQKFKVKMETIKKNYFII